jgi:hypothetical protein
MQRRVFFSPSAETDPRERVSDEPAGDHAASSAEAVPPIATPASVAPFPSVASADAVQDAADSGLPSGVDAKADRP